MGPSAPVIETSRSRAALLALPLLALALLSPFAGAACGKSGGTGPVLQRPDAGPACSPPGQTCPQGTVCNNRVCIKTCAADGTGCDADQFCQGTEFPRLVCSPKELKQCTIDQHCPLPQFCRSGLCISTQPRRDGGTAACLIGGADDACGPEAVCLQTAAGLRNCVGMPACAQDGTCPVGDYGSVCNDLPDGGRLFPAKQRVCLYAFCTSNANCASEARCFVPSNADPLGQCMFGLPGDLCFTAEDCRRATSCAGADGGFEDGGIPGVCQ